jgi:hypothetical protein
LALQFDTPELVESTGLPEHASRMSIAEESH